MKNKICDFNWSFNVYKHEVEYYNLKNKKLHFLIILMPNNNTGVLTIVNNLNTETATNTVSITTTQTWQASRPMNIKAVQRLTRVARPQKAHIKGNNIKSFDKHIKSGRRIGHFGKRDTKF